MGESPSNDPILLSCLLVLCPTHTKIHTYMHTPIPCCLVTRLPAHAFVCQFFQRIHIHPALSHPLSHSFRYVHTSDRVIETEPLLAAPLKGI
jgi:hypothetical protein